MTTCPETTPVLFQNDCMSENVDTIIHDYSLHDKNETDVSSEKSERFSRRLSFPVEKTAPSPLDLLFPLILIATVTFSIGGGFLARKVPPIRKTITRSIRTIKTEFSIREPKKIEKPPAPKPIEKKKPLDLGEKPKETKVPQPPEREKELTTAPPPKTKVRKVFGLRRVYSTGLGSGGSMANAVIGKIGNTIDKSYDTITATETDIKGAVVSTATVTTAPRFKKVIKPSYTKEMIEQKVQGTVKVKVLVDIDGKVKKATCLNDIGFDSAAQAIKATMAMEFEPAVRGSEPVAVWIIVPIKFVLLT
jgi:hypothetical protein